MINTGIPLSESKSALKLDKKVKKCPVLMLMELRLTAKREIGMSLAIWNHTVLPSTRHKWTHPRQIGRYSIYLPWRDGRLSWPCVFRFQSPMFCSRVVTHKTSCTTISRCVTPLPGFTEMYGPAGVECTDIQMLASSCKLKATIEPALYPVIANGRLPGRPARFKGPSLHR